MWSEGDKVCFVTWVGLGAIERQVIKKGTITSTFYEPGDPIQGVNIMGDDGKPCGGLDSQNCYPLDMYDRLVASGEFVEE